MSAFEKEIGMSNGTFGSAIRRGGSISADKIEKFLRSYPDVNPEWILLENGSMLRDDATQEEQTDPSLHNVNINAEQSEVMDLDFFEKQLTKLIDANQKAMEMNTKLVEALHAKTVQDNPSDAQNKMEQWMNRIEQMFADLNERLEELEEFEELQKKEDLEEPQGQKKVS